MIGSKTIIKFRQQTVIKAPFSRSELLKDLHPYFYAV
jgi:hypothetical protein